MFLLIPYGHTAVTNRIAWTNYSIIAANVLVFIWELAVQGEGVERFALHPQGDDMRPYQLVTHAFIHADLLHLIGNMLFLWVFGNAVNDRLGHWLYAVVYFCFVGLAGLGYLFVDGRRPMVGASGAICGIVGMFFVLLAGIEVKCVFSLMMFWWKRITIGAFWLIGFWVASDMAWMLLLSEYSAVAYSAHVAGYVAGLGVAIVFLKTRLIDPTDDDLFHLTNMRRVNPGPTRARIESMDPIPPTERTARKENEGQSPLFDPLNPHAP